MDLSKTYNQKSIQIIYAFTIASFLLHFVVNAAGAYGFFRDEFYYIACSDHLDWGYVDQPPLSILILKVIRIIFGDSLVAIRLLPAVCVSLTIYLTGLITIKMGGNRSAVFISCFTIFFSFIHIGMSNFYSMNAIDILIWAIAFYIVAEILITKKQTLWIWLGIVLGLGLMNKISVLFLGAGIFAAFLITDERRWFKTKWPYLCGLIAFVLFTPYIIWNINHDFAHLEFIKNAQEGKYSERTRIDFVAEQFLNLNPLNLPIWLTGLIVLTFGKQLKQFRVLGLIFIAAFFILLVNRTSKGEYLAPAYAPLFAAAGVYFGEKIINKIWRSSLIVYGSLILILSVILMPAVLPLMPVETYIKYSKALHLPVSSTENKKMSELPQHYADMFGWKEKAQDVAKVFHSLSKEDQKKCAIIAFNYGRCGAIDYYGKDLGLPKSIGDHNNYWIWGPRDYTGEVLIIVGGTLEEHVDDFESVVQAGVSDCDYCLPYEDNVRIFICRGLKMKAKDVWQHVKHYE